jgi:hypothetical protein
MTDRSRLTTLAALALGFLGSAALPAHAQPGPGGGPGERPDRRPPAGQPQRRPQQRPPQRPPPNPPRPTGPPVPQFSFPPPPPSPSKIPAWSVCRFGNNSKCMKMSMQHS